MSEPAEETEGCRRCAAPLHGDQAGRGQPRERRCRSRAVASRQSARASLPAKRRAARALTQFVMRATFKAWSNIAVREAVMSAGALAVKKKPGEAHSRSGLYRFGLNSFTFLFSLAI